MEYSMVKTITYKEASPFIDYIQKNKQHIIGKSIKGFYSDGFFGYSCFEPLAFEFDDFVIILRYYFYSDITIHIVDPDFFHSDNSKNSSEKPNLCYYIDKTDFPYINCKIIDIEVERFSEEFEINPSTRKTRPKGGDYFRTITVHLEGGNKFHICALSAISDGGTIVWDW